MILSEEGLTVLHILNHCLKGMSNEWFVSSYSGQGWISYWAVSLYRQQLMAGCIFLPTRSQKYQTTKLLDSDITILKHNEADRYETKREL